MTGISHGCAGTHHQLLNPNVFTPSTKMQQDLEDRWIKQKVLLTDNWGIIQSNRRALTKSPPKIEIQVNSQQEETRGEHEQKGEVNKDNNEVGEKNG